MKRTLLAVALGVVIGAAPFVLDFGLPTAQAKGDAKTSFSVAVIDLDRTLYETEAGKKADKKFEKARKKKQDELDKKQKELQKYAAELDKQATVLKEDVLKQKKSDLEKKFVELQQLYVKLEKDLAEERTKLIQDLLKQASPFVEEIAKSKGVDIIVDANAVVWASAAVDLTDDLNKKMK